VRVAWWDLTEDKAREAIIPARRINVGLPERADVLAKLAADNKRTYQLTKWAARFNAANNLIWLLPIISFGMACWLLHRALQPAHYIKRLIRQYIVSFTQQRWQHKFTKAVNASDWPQAYALLQQLNSSHATNENAMAWQTLHETITRLAFQQDSATKNSEDTISKSHILLAMKNALQTRITPATTLPTKRLPSL